MEPETCPGCGCEWEVMGRVVQGGETVGHQCTCGAVVIKGILGGVVPGDVSPRLRLNKGVEDG